MQYQQFQTPQTQQLTAQPETKKPKSKSKPKTK
jgi:hypothetical protein